jgi:hypothetical protein
MYRQCHLGNLIVIDETKIKQERERERGREKKRKRTSSKKFLL